MATTKSRTKGIPASGWMHLAHGSYGSRGGEPWSEKIAQANRRTRPEGQGAGVSDGVVPPSKEAMRAAIDAQACPWCGAGPFKALAMHTNKEHGVDRHELRELAGLPRSASICSPEFSERARDSLLSREDREEMSARGSAAGQQAGVQAAKALTARRYLDENRARDAAIIEAVQSGVPRQDVAASFGLACKTVQAVLKRHGITVDGRKESGRRRKGVRPTGARAGVEKRRAERLAERTARWHVLGGDHAGLVELAAELGVSHKTLREYFKSSGLPVPDGRK